MAMIVDTSGAERRLGDEPLALGPSEASAPTVRRSGRSWALLGTGLSVNGWATSIGIVVLEDADEIVVGGERFVFSARGSAEPFRWRAERGDEVCPRCHEQLAEGDRVVRCPTPRCGLVHHDTPERPCWTRGGCPVCGAAPIVDNHTT